jgi:uncharacterized protein YbaR (Trm112 family)
MLSEKLLESLVCPVSKTKLKYDENNQELVCEESGLAYPIVNGIPVLLRDEARLIDESNI